MVFLHGRTDRGVKSNNQKNDRSSYLSLVKLSRRSIQPVHTNRNYPTNTACCGDRCAKSWPGDKV